MYYHTLHPGPALNAAVERLWLYEGYRPPHEFERVLPAGTVEIIINLGEDELRCYDPDTLRPERLGGAIVTGVHRRHFIIDTRQQHSMMGVALRPGGAWRLLGVAGEELTDSHVGLEAILGRNIRHLRERLQTTPDPGARLQCLADALGELSLRNTHPVVIWAADQFCRYPGAVRVADLTEESGLSARRFYELFRREIGISPKGFARIRRFQAALARIQTMKVRDGCGLAAAFGYADQAHLIREFHEFTGLTPGAYAAVRGDRLDPVPEGEWDQICPVTGSGAMAPR